MKLLIAYASVQGSTAQTAQFIARTLTARGIEVRTAAVNTLNPDDLAVDACILGSPIHSGIWLPEMAVFARRFQSILSQMPMFGFLTCIRVLEPGGYTYVMQHYVPNTSLLDLKARHIAIFPGKLDLTAIDWSERWTLSMRYDGNLLSHHDGDFRDWDTVGVWGERIADELLPHPGGHSVV